MYIVHTLNLSVNGANINNVELTQVLRVCKTIIGHLKHSTYMNEN